MSTTDKSQPPQKSPLAALTLRLETASLTLLEASILHLISLGNRYPFEFKDQLGHRSGTISNSYSQLEEKGLINKEKLSSRTVRLSLTEKGAETLSQIIKKSQAETP